MFNSEDKHMLDININESRDLNFKIEISGIVVSQLEGRLRMIIDNIEYGFPAKVSEGSIDIVIPPLKNIIQRDLKEGENFLARLEVQGDGNYLNPWNGEFQIHNPVAIKAKIVENEKDIKPAISVSISESVDIESNKTELDGDKQVKLKISEMENQVAKIKKFKDKDDFKNNVTKEDVIKWLSKKGTKSPQVQEIIYEQALSQAGSGSPYKILLELTKVIKK